MLDTIHQVSPDKIHEVQWEGDSLYYDLQLYNLGEGHEEFLVINPVCEDVNILRWVNQIPTTRKCIVFEYQGQWIAKLFKDGWYPYHGYESVDIVVPELVWTRNNDIDSRMTFDSDPRAEYTLDFWDKDYELVWKLDPRFFPEDGEVRVYTAKVIGSKSTRTKFMGYLVPDVDVEFNEHLPDLGINIDECCPAFWDLSDECAYELDPACQTPDLTERMWVVKFRPNWRKPKSWRWYGTITPQYKVTTNPDLPELNFEVDYTIPWHDLKYEHMWMLDPKHTVNASEPVWAFKVSAADSLDGTKIMGDIEPIGELEINGEVAVPFSLPKDFAVQYHDIAYQFVWVAKEGNEKIWLAKLSYVDDPIGVKEIEITDQLNPDALDVIFISYFEPNAEDNWKRVKEKAPWAQRVDGVKGILAAHKEAAKRSRTDMFYVVDGDAFLFKKFEFKYKPSIFDRDCTYIWSAKNPLVDLTYGHGGVKLFSKEKLLKLKKWRTLDMTTSVSEKIKVMSEISNWTAYNTDLFSVWKTAFRECVKLAFNVHRYPDNPEHSLRLDKWKEVDTNSEFAGVTVYAQEQAKQFVEDNSHDMAALTQINDRDWLLDLYNNTYLKEQNERRRKSA
jgi:hypothetical protein